MEPQETASPNPEAAANGTWRWIRITLGGILAVLGISQAYLMLSPALELLEFVPLSFLISEMAPTLLLLHPYALAVLALVLGGVLLALRRRAGYVLVFMACCLFLVALVEVIVVTSQLQDSSIRMLMDEMLADTGWIFAVAHILYVVALVLVHLRPARMELGIRRKQVWIAVGIATFLVLDLNFTAAYLFLWQ